jgi:hypothetical protein
MKTLNAVAIDSPELPGQPQEPRSLDAVLRDVCTSQQFQLADAQDRQNLLLAAILVQSQAPHVAPRYSPLRVDLREESSVSIGSKDFDCQPSTKSRKFKTFCKVLLLAYVFYWFSVGQPDLFFKGIYQGFVHGWQSECSDWYSCPEKTQP